MERSSYAGATGSKPPVGYVRLPPELKAWAVVEAARRGQSFNLFVESLIEAERRRCGTPGAYQSVIDKMGGKA